jgi:hypothetical protein
MTASEAPRPGRHHLGMPGAIKSECLGGFVGIGTAGDGGQAAPMTRLHRIA